MNLRRALLPLAVVALLGLATAGVAEAAPVSTLPPTPSVAFGPNVHVGVGVGVAVPLGPRHRGYRRGHGVRRGYGHRGYGRWIVQRERVWVPGDVIGYDRFGHPIVTEGFWAVERRRVWVPGPRRYAPVRPHGRVAVGMVFH